MQNMLKFSSIKLNEEFSSQNQLSREECLLYVKDLSLFSNGELKEIFDAQQEFSKRVLICCLQFPQEHDLEIRKYLMKNYSSKICEMLFVKDSGILNLFSQCRENDFEPYYLISNEENQSFYQKEIEKNHDSLHPAFKFYCCPPLSINFLDVRLALQQDNEGLFQNLTPSFCHQYYKQFKKRMKS